MKKKGISLHYITLSLILQVFGISAPVMAISDAQKEVISTYCGAIHDNLRDLQRSDSRMMMDIGHHYEVILANFITPLNLRLVENNLPDTDLINNQNIFSQTRIDFVASYVDYQKSLEELLAFDCKKEPEEFYEKLEGVREKRKIVADGTTKLGRLAKEQVKLVKVLETKL